MSKTVGNWEIKRDSSGNIISLAPNYGHPSNLDPVQKRGLIALDYGFGRGRYQEMTGNLLVNSDDDFGPIDGREGRTFKDEKTGKTVVVYSSQICS